MIFRQVCVIADGTTFSAEQLQISRRFVFITIKLLSAASKHNCYINVKEVKKFKFDSDSDEIIGIYFTFC